VLRAFWKAFRKSSAAQDVAEYCLITALVALVGLAIFIHISGGVQSIWSTANSTLAGTTAPPAQTGTTTTRPAAATPGVSADFRR